MKRKSVTEAEFNSFLKAYPRPLERHVATICDPPQIHYCDGTLGEWPEFVVASHWFSDLKGTIPSDWKIMEE